MKDIQNQNDDNHINIKKVGVKRISYPISLLDKSKKKQHTVAAVNMYVNLPHHFKGTHMSRFVEILNRFHGDIDLRSFHYILEEMKSRLDAEAAHVEMTFPYFLRSKSNDDALKESRYDCELHGSFENVDDLMLKFTVPLSLPIKTVHTNGLSKSMGHWGQVKVDVRFNNFVWIEDLINLVEQTVNEEHQREMLDAEPSLSVEYLTELLAKNFIEHEAIKWFSLSVENLADGYTTFATIEN